jgi:hypothetical protein
MRELMLDKLKHGWWLDHRFANKSADEFVVWLKTLDDYDFLDVYDQNTSAQNELD